VQRSKDLTVSIAERSSGLSDTSIAPHRNGLERITMKRRATVYLAASVLVVLLSFFTLVGCNSGNEISATVYVAGYYDKGSNDVAAYWKDDASGKVDLFATGNARANSVFVYGNDVYVAGYFTNSKGNNAAGYWKNGTLVELYSDTDLAPPDGTARANAIFVDGSDVYVAGYYNEGTQSACYWKNGTKTDLYTTATSDAFGIFVFGTDVYVAGYYISGNDVSCYWLNDSAGKTDLYSADYSRANSIYFDGTNVYIAGYYVVGAATTACYWQNIGAFVTDLASSPGAKAESIVVSGTDVYVAGHYRNASTNDVACYWKTTSAGLVDLYNDTTYDALAYSIYLNNADVYVAGYYDEGTQSACYWKNGDRTVLYSAAASSAYSVVVK
jgi:hypothetical protein